MCRLNIDEICTPWEEENGGYLELLRSITKFFFQQDEVVMKNVFAFDIQSRNQKKKKKKVSLGKE